MRAYLVNVGGVTRFAGSQAEVREVKTELCNLQGISTRAKTVSVTEVEIPTNKEGLLGFINELVSNG